MLWLLLFVANGLVHTNAQNAGFTQSDIDTMRAYFEDNIGVAGCSNGFVVASPSGGQGHNAGDPDYYYHWQRDASISMLTLAYTTSNNFSNKTINSMYQNYVKWIETVQTAPDPINNYCNIFGEPKFYCNASVFDGGWCRPQNDGPATRAQAMTFYANYLLDNGGSDYVSKHLFNASNPNTKGTCNVLPQESKVDCGHEGTNQANCTSVGCCWYPLHDSNYNVPWCYASNGTGTPAGGAIGKDLNYVYQAWKDNSGCDLWEEERGLFFYTTMVQRNSLLYAAKLAKKLGDADTQKLWNDAATDLVPVIQNFTNSESIIVDGQRVHDCSVILGSLYGGTPNIFLPNADPLYPPSDVAVAASVNDTVTYWTSEYAINADDTSDGVPGVLIGRYAQDTYPGCNSNGGSQGHAWILCSNALADYYYRVCNDFYTNSDSELKMIISEKHLRIFSDLFAKDQPILSLLLLKHSELWDGYSMDEKREVSKVLGLGACTQGDNQLQRVAYHVKPCDDRMSEQLCEAHKASGGGQEVGAHDLTWSYGTVLSAWYYRSLAMDNIKANGDNFYPQEISYDFDWMMQNNQATCAGCSSQCSD